MFAVRSVSQQLALQAVLVSARVQLKVSQHVWVHVTMRQLEVKSVWQQLVLQVVAVAARVQLKVCLHQHAWVHVMVKLKMAAPVQRAPRLESEMRAVVVQRLVSASSLRAAED